MTDFLDSHPTLVKSLAVLGGGLIFKYLFDLSRMMLDFTLPGIPLTKFGAKKGGWAVVTGASDGIGRDFAIQLAGKGFNVVLVARTKAKLDAVAQEIANKYPQAETLVLTVDFSNRAQNAGSYEQLAESLNKLDVGVLVNNAGVSYQHAEYFHEVEDATIEAIVDVNVHSVYKVTKLVLPGMVSRRRGLIINTGSFSGYISAPYLAAYSSTKAALQSFSQCLGEEYKSKGIVVSNLNMYFIVTKMSKFKRPNFLVPTSSNFVRAALSRVGARGGATTSPYVSTPYFSHALYNFVIDHFLSRGFVMGMAAKSALEVRKRVMRKREREAQQQLKKE